MPTAWVIHGLVGDTDRDLEPFRRVDFSVPNPKGKRSHRGREVEILQADAPHDVQARCVVKVGRVGVGEIDAGGDPEHPAKAALEQRHPTTRATASSGACVLARRRRGHFWAFSRFWSDIRARTDSENQVTTEWTHCGGVPEKSLDRAAKIW